MSLSEVSNQTKDLVGEKATMTKIILNQKKPVLKRSNRLKAWGVDSKLHEVYYFHDNENNITMSFYYVPDILLSAIHNFSFIILTTLIGTIIPILQ